MDKLFAVSKTLVSEEILKNKFVCDLNACKGACCIAGVSGAPLEKEEAELLEKILPEIKPFMSSEGVKAVEKQGVGVIDEDRELTTPLVNGGKCAFVYMENKTAKCAIEKAFNQGTIKFKKPISCHLYPIRLSTKKGLDKLEYHQWNICKPACSCGEKLNVPVYKFLKEPLVRKYGEVWYESLRLLDEKRVKE